MVGENKDFAGANGITAANRLLKDLKVSMRVNSDNVACSGPTTATVGPSPIMTGVVGGITIDCASSMTNDGEELFSSGTMWIGGEAIDLYNP